MNNSQKALKHVTAAKQSKNNFMKSTRHTVVQQTVISKRYFTGVLN